MLPLIRSIYKSAVPAEVRFWLYKKRNPVHMANLRKRVNPSPKGDFSLAPYDQKKAIFVHITKTAGTSVALTLFGALPYHYRAWEYRVIFGKKDFNDYFKFAFVRNPWDRLYSAFSFLKGGGWDDNDKRWAEENLAGIDDFNDFVINWLTPERLYAYIHFWPQSDFICDGKNRAMIDYLAYFETIGDDFDRIAKQIDCKESLQHTNASKRKGYKEVYSEEARQKVALLYARDINNFGYRFDGFSRHRVDGASFVSE